MGKREWIERKENAEKNGSLDCFEEILRKTEMRSLKNKLQFVDILEASIEIGDV